MIILTIAILVAIAAVGGYVLGTRARARRIVATLAPPLPPSPMPATAPPALPPIELEAERVSCEKARIIRSRDSETASLRRELADRDVAQPPLELGREREQLFGELADARGECARYRQLVIDIENNAPPPILSGVGEPDDLKLIVGIGPVLERMLHSLGITQFRQIARWTERDASEFDAKLPEFPGRIQRDQWVTQARELHRSKYGAQP